MLFTDNINGILPNVSQCFIVRLDQPIMVREEARMCTRSRRDFLYCVSPGRQTRYHPHCVLSIDRRGPYLQRAVNSRD